MKLNRLSQSLLVLLLLTMVTAGMLSGCVAEPPPPTVVEPPDDEQPEPADNEEWKDDPYLILVSARHPLPENQEPELKAIQGSFKMEVTAADAMIAMLQAAKEEAGINLLVVSSYRSQEKQRQLFEAKVQQFLNSGYSQGEAESLAAARVARPGTSEHNTGLAADVVTPDHQWLDASFAKTAAAKWMKENCARFGFILRYPEDKQEVTGIIFEPWHFRYVGIEHAQKIMEQGLCLEEYLAGE
ncbi:MAG: M15 family metallopeptidase [Bacillota bacterium]|jgi:D-alanyl-D-alanine carboxypeptidase